MVYNSAASSRFTFQQTIQSDKNNGHFTWWPFYIFDHISLNTQNGKCFRQKL